MSDKTHEETSTTHEGANILDLDWEDLIETLPATEEAIASAKAKAFAAEEEITKKLPCISCVSTSHENDGR